MELIICNIGLFSTVLKKESDSYYLVTPVEKVPVKVELAPYVIIDFKINNSSVWAVQYHPEFDPLWIAGLMKQREDILLKENAFTEKKFFDEELEYFSNYKNIHNEKYTEIYKDLISPKHMVRLLQGDVGSGKTIVALLAMIQGVDSNFQSVLMAPT